MKPACEIMVQQIFPGIRAMIVMELRDNYGLNQLEIAKKLGITQPAVSQYMRQLRGKCNKELRNAIIVKEVKKLCSRISKGITYDELNAEFCHICRSIRRRKIVCSLHKSQYPLMDCNLCNRV